MKIYKGDEWFGGGFFEEGGKVFGIMTPAVWNIEAPIVQELHWDLSFYVDVEEVE